MQAIDSKSKLLDFMVQGALVLTPNNRLSDALLQNYYQHCTQATVDKPACMPYGVALVQSYQKLMSLTPEQQHPLLLNAAQCQFLWRSILKSKETITYSEGLLNAVLEAWSHCEQWQINPQTPDFNYTAQTQQFQQWWQQFNARCKSLQTINEHQIVPYLIHSGLELFSRPVIWVCFEEFSPQQLSLQQWINQCGQQQFSYDLQDNTTQPQVFAAKDNAEEKQQLLYWLQSKLAQGEQRIGVVVPDLQKESAHLKRLLRTHFSPDQFNISLGQALSEFPIIAHALSWLQLDGTKMTPDQAALLLQSPYLGGAKSEFIPRSQYLQNSSLLQKQRFSFSSLIQDLKPQIPKLAALLSAITPYPSKATPQQWVQLFQERLNALGFPGDSGLNSENYQCHNRFGLIFDEFMQLALIRPEFTNNEALYALSRLTTNTVFQAQKTSAQIQISGLLEATGCEFDSLWIMGLSNTCLPNSTRLSPFVPNYLQRELHMPHSLASKELMFATQILERLRRGSTSIILSYPKLQGDNPQLPCSLIADYPQFQKPVSIVQQNTTVSLETVEEDYVVPILSTEKIKGGTSLLASQAQCPFKSFANFRLKAVAIQSISEGLDNKERGQLIHKIMELFWKELNNQGNLLQLSAQELDQHIDKTIALALKPITDLHADCFPELIKEVELTRLKRSVMACVEWEKQRAPFEVTALEESYHLELAGLEFNVRVDRIDTVDNNKWVIDYKSSLPGSKPWNEDRPKEPQLLLYALLDQAINALLLIEIKSGKLAFSGLSEDKQDIRGVSALKKDEAWEKYTTLWREQLTAIAQEIQQGYCPPIPAQTSICQTCDYQNLCRYQAL